MENIKQVFTVEWKGREGDIMVDVLGLGEDSLIYRWHKGTGKWVLYIITK